MADLRLGDVIDDWCVKCRRLTNHSVVSIVGGVVAKVRCRTCYHDHDYRHEEPPPSKKDLKKQALFDEVLATINPDAAAANEDSGAAPEEAAETIGEAPASSEPVANSNDGEPEVAQPPPASRRKASRKARNNG